MIRHSWAGAALVALALFASTVSAQRVPAPLRPASPDWRHIGNSAYEFSLPSVATGPVDRVWYSADGSQLFAKSAVGSVFQTVDFESWKPSAAAPPESLSASTFRKPEASARVRAAGYARTYALGRFVWRSDDGGYNWSNLTGYRQRSILGDGLTDLAVSPSNPDEIVVSNKYGVWRSLDGGLSWTGLNSSLPNLPVRRILALPSGILGARLLLGDALEAQWAPGEKVAWKTSTAVEYAQELSLRRQLSALLQADISAAASVNGYIYAGSEDGRLWASQDQGQTWSLPFQAGNGRVESILAESSDPRLALAALGGKTGSRVLRTISAGSYWRDLTANLPETAVFGVAADRGSGAVYAATAKGVFYTISDLQADAPPTAWMAVGNLPDGSVRDVKLDAGKNQLYAAVEGYGVYVAIAPHRLAAFRVVSAADLVERAAAPGALLSVLGSRVLTAKSGDTTVPVLSATETSSQIQVPFEAAGNSLQLALEAAGGRYSFGLPLLKVSPAIFVDPEGSPFVIDSDSGVMVNSTNPVRSGERIQVLVSGLGRTQPDWPTGLAAPLENPPVAVAAVKAWVDRIPVTVVRATLAPGYIGFYLVELEVPDLVNAGPADLVIEADGQASNHVRIYLEP